MNSLITALHLGSVRYVNITMFTDFRQQKQTQAGLQGSKGEATPGPSPVCLQSLTVLQTTSTASIIHSEWRRPQCDEVDPNFQSDVMWFTDIKTHVKGFILGGVFICCEGPRIEGVMLHRF